MKIIQGIVAVVITIFLIGLLLPDSDTQQPQSTEIQWFQGGTLHEASVTEWRSAVYRNKLATASDWTAIAIGQAEFERIGIDGVRSKSEALVECIDGSTDGLSGVETLSTRELGAACIVLMKW